MFLNPSKKQCRNENDWVFCNEIETSISFKFGKKVKKILVLGKLIAVIKKFLFKRGSKSPLQKRFGYPKLVSPSTRYSKVVNFLPRNINVGLSF